MDHRETPPRARAEDRRFARLVPLPAERRVVLGRLGLAGLAGVLALALALVVGSHLLGGMKRWLHAQPAYQTTFGAIELDPPPPRWYRGGTAAFLDAVRRGAERGTEPFSALDLDKAELLREFRLYCWVRRAVLAEHKTPNRIIVHLEYRRPVAAAWIGRGEGQHQGQSPGPRRLLLDEDGVILPAEDVDVDVNVEEDALAPLILLEGFDRPADLRPGLAWTSEDPAHGPGRANDRVLAAVALATALRGAMGRPPAKVPAALRVVAIHADRENHVYWVETAERTMIYWPVISPRDAPGQPTFDQRWNEFRAWNARRGAAPAPVVRPYYLRFTRDGLVVQKGI
jgi:hypothetical protein